MYMKSGIYENVYFKNNHAEIRLNLFDQLLNELYECNAVINELKFKTIVHEISYNRVRILVFAEY